MVSRDALPDGLLADVKNYLDITWTDEGTDAKVSGLIASAMVYLNSKLGADADYTADGFARMLLMDFVRYARSGALDVFEANYTDLILAMQNEKAVSEYAQNAVSPEQ